MTSPAFIKTDRLTLRVIRAGNGPRLLFLGGTGWDLRTDTAPMQTSLIEHFDIVHFDQRGMGQSDKPDGPYTMMDYADDAIALLDKIGWADTYAVGFSFGGMVAQELAINYPQRIRAMTLISTTAGGAGGSSYPIHEFADWPPEEKARQALQVSDLRFTEQYQLENPNQALQAIRDRLPSNPEFMQEPGAKEGRDRQLAARAAHDCYDRLHEIATPTLVIGGESDGQAPAHAVAKLAERIPHAHLNMLSGAHGLIFEHDQAYGAIIQFFSDQSDGGIVT